MTLLYQMDRWRDVSQERQRVQLAGPPYNAEAGSFSFVLKPWIKDGGHYRCEVFLNDNIFVQRTILSVLKGTDRGVEETDRRRWIKRNKRWSRD